jgi:hypothetical protein
MVKSIRLSLARGCAAAQFLVAGAALAQPPASYSDVPDQFRLEVGGFRVGSDTELTFNTSGGSRPPVDFESLDLPENATQGYIEGFWRPWRRHQFSLSWYRNNREGDPTTSTREFVWGDRVVTVGSTVRAKIDSHYLSGVYRFAAYKSDRFEIGPSIGLGYLSIDAGVSGDVSATGAPGTVSGPFDISKNIGEPTGDLGGYLYWWPIRRLLIRGDLRYILVKPENSEASVTDGRAAAIYHPGRHIGIGLQYTYSKFRYDRTIVSSELGGRLRYSGGQVVVSAAF